MKKKTKPTTDLLDRASQQMAHARDVGLYDQVIRLYKKLHKRKVLRELVGTKKKKTMQPNESDMMKKLDDFIKEMKVLVKLDKLRQLKQVLDEDNNQ